MGKSRRHGGHCRFTSDCILLRPQGGLVNTQQVSLKPQWKFCEIVQGYINTVHIINVILIPPLISLLLSVFLPLICPCHLLSTGLIYRQPSLSSCASGAECVFVCVPMWESERESRRIIQWASSEACSCHLRDIGSGAYVPGGGELYHQHLLLAHVAPLCQRSSSCHSVPHCMKTITWPREDTLTSWTWGLFYINIS